MKVLLTGPRRGREEREGQPREEEPREKEGVMEFALVTIVRKKTWQRQQRKSMVNTGHSGMRGVQEFNRGYCTEDKYS